VQCSAAIALVSPVLAGDRARTVGDMAGHSDHMHSSTATLVQVQGSVVMTDGKLLCHQVAGGMVGACCPSPPGAGSRRLLSLLFQFSLAAPHYLFFSRPLQAPSSGNGNFTEAKKDSCFSRN
jgi:hypothetical protein